MLSQWGNTENQRLGNLLQNLTYEWIIGYILVWVTSAIYPLKRNSCNYKYDKKSTHPQKREKTLANSVLIVVPSNR